MTEESFSEWIAAHAAEREQIRQSAYELHRSVNQTYGDGLPYGVHLDKVAEGVIRYGRFVCDDEADLMPLIFSAYFHDSIEDARQTYNDVLKRALQWMDDRQAHIAAEVVYALTNDKGRTRDERAGEHYYQGIRQTPYAPFVKLADRWANATFSSQANNPLSVRMKEVYLKEMPHFLEAINAHSDDKRFSLPIAMIEEVRGKR